MGCKMSREAVFELKGRKLFEIKRLDGIQEMPKCKVKPKKRHIISSQAHSEEQAYDLSKGSEGISKNDIDLVRESWKQLTISGDYKFYGTIMMIKIFKNHPELKSMWKFAANLETEEEMKESNQLRSHGNKIFESINGAVNSLDNLHVLNVRLSKLGLRHQSYGAQGDQYLIVKEAFVQTIEEILGEKFTNKHLTAWNNVMEYFCQQMIKSYE